MKKLLLVGAVAVLGLASCKKDYTCTYTYDVLGTEYTASVDCLKCSKSDIEEIESVGYGDNYYECEAK